MQVFQGWAEVAQRQDELAARLTVDQLRSHDIEATFLSQKDRWHVVSFGGLAVIRVLVPAISYLEAREVLRDAQDIGPRSAE